MLDELARDPNNMMRKYRAAFAQGRGVAWDKSGTFNQRHAIPVTDVASWINANLTSGRSEQSRVLPFRKMALTTASPNRKIDLGDGAGSCIPY
ncbi:hypothetical protein QZM81_15970 [Burkholderia cepacia]|nr:hypothetical protein [Burkholderia cepacia]MCE4127995.1 hypothetical protein [Burkholderia cepacia]MDN7857304.1 hypothetical protein [Burkholderia cepacia]